MSRALWLLTWHEGRRAASDTLRFRRPFVSMRRLATILGASVMVAASLRTPGAVAALLGREHVTLVLSSLAFLAWTFAAMFGLLGGGFPLDASHARLLAALPIRSRSIATWIVLRHVPPAIAASIVVALQARDAATPAWRALLGVFAVACVAQAVHLIADGARGGRTMRWIAPVALLLPLALMAMGGLRGGGGWSCLSLMAAPASSILAIVTDPAAAAWPAAAAAIASAIAIAILTASCPQSLRCELLEAGEQQERAMASLAAGGATGVAASGRAPRGALRAFAWRRMLCIRRDRARRVLLPMLVSWCGGMGMLVHFTRSPIHAAEGWMAGAAFASFGALVAWRGDLRGECDLGWLLTLPLDGRALAWGSVLPLAAITGLGAVAACAPALAFAPRDRVLAEGCFVVALPGAHAIVASALGFGRTVTSDLARFAGWLIGGGMALSVLTISTVFGTATGSPLGPVVAAAISASFGAIAAETLGAAFTLMRGLGLVRHE